MLIVFSGRPPSRTSRPRRPSPSLSRTARPARSPSRRPPARLRALARFPSPLPAGSGSSTTIRLRATTSVSLLCIHPCQPRLTSRRGAQHGRQPLRGGSLVVHEVRRRRQHRHQGQLPGRVLSVSPRATSRTKQRIDDHIRKRTQCRNAHCTTHTIYYIHLTYERATL